MPWKWLLALILILPFAGMALGQTASNDESAPTSLADAAKKNKDTSKNKAKRVFTDDDMSLRKSPIPAIALEGPDNSQTVLDAIHQFKGTHDPAETERVLHEWYDEQAEVLSAAIDANNRIAQHNQIKMEAAQDGYGYGGPYGNYDGDYNKLRQRQLSEMWAQRSDARSNRDNWQVVTRIQQAFLRVRCDAIWNRSKMPYDWFRIRNANGVGTY
ncbi:MAG: hypothetical protein WAJ97_01925 [Terriglobales bacterium]|jgi:hypothetical protein